MKFYITNLFCKKKNVLKLVAPSPVFELYRVAQKERMFFK